MKTDYTLYESVDKIAGWLRPPAALRTMDILSWQKSQDIQGGVLEIGVYCGKYFALLVNSAREMESPVLGIDTFEFAPKSRVLMELETVFGKEVRKQTRLWKTPSSAVRPIEIERKVGLCRFISIDGAHDYENVFRDLVLAEQVISPNGIISADDFLNPLALGVNAAINVFLSQPRAVVPVAYISNKLFLAHRSREADYRAAIEEMIMNGDDPQSANFRKMIKNGRHHVEQEFHGHKVLLS